MTTAKDNHHTAGTLSVSWRAHAPAAALVVIGALFSGGTCTKQDEVLRRLDDLNTRVSRIEGALGVANQKHADIESAGGFPAVTVTRHP